MIWDNLNCYPPGAAYELLIPPKKWWDPDPRLWRAISIGHLFYISTETHSYVEWVSDKGERLLFYEGDNDEEAEACVQRIIQMNPEDFLMEMML